MKTEERMRIAIDYGRQRIELEVDQPVHVRRAAVAPPLTDVPAMVAVALENPFEYPALRRALTPDDHIALVIDESLPQLARFLIPILEHLVKASISPEAITIVCATATSQSWVDDLPDAFQEVKIEVHDPKERKKLAYLATSKQGRRIYVNRTVVDADQIVVLCRICYDTVLGAVSGESAFYPALSDEATLQELAGKRCTDTAREVAWLLGAPFLVQVIDASGEDVAHVIGGSLASSQEARRLLEQRWRVEIDQPAQTVVAAVSGEPGFATLAQGLANAAQGAEPGGCIILLSGASFTPPDVLRQADSPAAALDRIKQEASNDRATLQWLKAVERNRIYLLSGLDADTAEELFVTPLDKPEQAQKLLKPEETCLVLPDVDKTLVAVHAATSTRA